MTLLQPGHCVKWQEDGVWKMGRVMCDRYGSFRIEYERNEIYPDVIVQCLDGLHVVCTDKLERVEARTD